MKTKKPKIRKTVGYQAMHKLVVKAYKKDKKKNGRDKHLLDG